MAFKYYLDGQLTDTPISDKELTSSIKRDRSTKILSITQDAELTYNGNNNLQPNTISGFDYLKNLFETQICNEVEVVITDEVSDTLTYHIYTGIIKIPSIRIDYQDQVLFTKVQDKGFYSYINNNKSVSVDLSSLFTKSNLPLAPIDWYSVDLFRQDVCLYGGVNNYYFKGFKVSDVFAFVIYYITDKKLTFQSNFFDSLTEPPFLFSGQALANSYTIYPNAQEPVIKITFNKLFEELSKIYNLVLYIDSTDMDNPVVRIEDARSTFEQSIGYEFNDIKELRSSIDASSLYAIVNVGSNTFIDTDTPNNQVPFPPDRAYFGWRGETYYPLGQCNVETTLDLVNDWIIDTNILWESINANSTTYFEDIFLIQCSNIDEYNKTADGHQFEFFGDGTCTYNQGLNNYNKLQRYSEDFESAFGTGFQSFTDGFRASLSNNIILEANPSLPLGGIYLPPNAIGTLPPATVLFNPLIFGDVTSGLNYNDGGNYNTSTGVYTIPTNGLYSFNFTMDYIINGAFVSFFTNFFFITIGIRHYDSSNVLKFQTGQTFTYGAVPPSGVNQQSNVDAVINAIAGDYVQTFLEVQYFSTNSFFNTEGVLIRQNTFFECTGTPSGGLTPATGTRQTKKYFFEFEQEIPESDWLNLTKNITKTIQFEKDGIIRYGWIDTIKRNDWDGIANIKLITSNATYTQ
jgi:hypothetical protein